MKEAQPRVNKASHIGLVLLSLILCGVIVGFYLSTNNHAVPTNVSAASTSNDDSDSLNQATQQKTSDTTARKQVPITEEEKAIVAEKEGLAIVAAASDQYLKAFDEEEKALAIKTIEAEKMIAALEIRAKQQAKEQAKGNAQ
jgi:hypothetical protein